MKIFGLVVALVLTAACTGGAAAQGPLFGRGDGPVDAATRREVIDTVLAKLRAQYVFPETAERMVSTVRARQKAGAYDQLATGKAFAEALTRDLNGIAHDKHLGVYYYDVNELATSSNAKPDPKVMAAFHRGAGRSNYGFPEVRILEGNVGYVKITGFTLPDWAAPTLAAAMTMVAGSDALILDLRGNTGGSADMVQLLMSYLVPARTHLNDIFSRPDSSTRQIWSLPAVAGERYAADKPVYVVTDAMTISAGEELAYDIQALERGKVVGEVTAGAANPGGLDRVNEHFAIFLPRGRAINPVTKTNWEGAGVKPDVPAPAARALDVAHLTALRAVMPKLTDADEIAEVRGEIARLDHLLR